VDRTSRKIGIRPARSTRPIIIAAVLSLDGLLVLSRAEVARLLDLEELLEALSAGFVELSAGRSNVPPRIAARSPEGLLAVMPGYLPGVGLESKLVSVFPANHSRGLPSHQALIVLFDPEDGSPRALMDGTHITAVRTAGASALATRVLARQDARTLLVYGAGVQGRAHLEAVARVRPFEKVRVVSRRRAAAERLASEVPGTLVASDPEAAVREADIVCLCTDAPEPVIRWDWLSPGTHLTSVGASTRGPELDRETVTGGRLVVESRVAFQPYPAGAHELQGLDPESAAELGEVISGLRAGRESAEQVTVYKSMGHAVEDAAAAGLVYRRALETGTGIRVSL
jgi:ornithine cyclodeaminase/alanine dehydrogenase-like protein (mu-crystallin family)